MTRPARADRGAGRYRRCDYCGYTLPTEPHRGERGLFCSTHCLEAGEPNEDEAGEEAPESVLEHDAYKRFVTGVEPLDALAPNGVPADALVLLAGEEGTRRTELSTELVWRALERGERAVLVAAAAPPAAALERFFAADWNVLPALEDDRLRVLDCVTGRLDDREGYLESRNEWGRFVADAAGDGIVEVSDPGDGPEVADALVRTLDDLEMTETGLVAVDSLDALPRDGSVRDVLTEVRATVCKARYVPVVAGAAADGDAAARVGEHAFDAVVDLRLTDRLAPEARLKRLGIRKLTGASHRPRWLAYEYAPERGLFSFDPETETERVYDVVGPGRPVDAR